MLSEAVYYPEGPSQVTMTVRVEGGLAYDVDPVGLGYAHVYGTGLTATRCGWPLGSLNPCQTVTITLDMLWTGGTDPTTSDYGSTTFPDPDGGCLTWTSRGRDTQHSAVATGFFEVEGSREDVNASGGLFSHIQWTQRECTPSPKPPAHVVIHSRNGSAQVSWTAAAGLHRWPVRSYTVTATPGGHTCTAVGELGCTITGLRNGTTYRIGVQTNAGMWTSLPSKPGLVVVGAPDAPAYLTVRSSGAGVSTARWAAPVSPGAGRVMGYQARWSSDGGRTWTPWSTSHPRSYAARTHLVVGHRYVVQVRAINRVGAGPSATLTFSQPR